MALPMEGKLIVETEDGGQVELAPGEGQRVLHALATLAQTPVGQHLTVRSVRTPDGNELWHAQQPAQA